MRAMSPGDPVLKWLQDLRFTTETECMSVLQGKSICKDSATNDVGSCSVRIIKENIEVIRANSLSTTANLTRMLKKMEKGRQKQVLGSCSWLVEQIRHMVDEWNSMLTSAIPDEIQEQEDLLLDSCSRLVHLCESTSNNKVTQETASFLATTIEDIVETFATLVDSFIGILIQCMVLFLDMNTSSSSCITMVVGELITLGLCGEHMCFIIAREGGVRALLGVCQGKQQQQQRGERHKMVADAVRAQALRALATLCCIPESIHELEEVDGVGCLAQLLADVRENSEMVRSEAAGVIAQITSPSLEHYEPITGFIENMVDLVQSLTELCSAATSHEVFLLGAAAIANITFMDPMSSDYLMQFDTIRILIEACQLQKAESLFAKDQVATVMANMAMNGSCFDEIISNNGLEVLIQFLSEHPSDYASSEAELAACERVQQKAAIALTRLSKDADNAQLIVELGGIQRLVQLCRDSKERHSSSAVLIAALAALRKIVAVLAAAADGLTSSGGSNGSSSGIAGLTLADVQQLIEPKLMDSYLICTKLYESYV